MAKKAKVIDLKSKGLEFEQNGFSHKLLSFKVNEQNLEVATYEDGKFIKNETIAFAHIPKNLKRLVKPL